MLQPLKIDVNASAVQDPHCTNEQITTIDSVKHNRQGQRSQIQLQNVRLNVMSEKLTLETPATNFANPTNTSPTPIDHQTPNNKNYNWQNNLQQILYQRSKDEHCQKSLSGKENRRSSYEYSQEILKDNSKSHFRSLTNFSDIAFDPVQYENYMKETQRISHLLHNDEESAESPINPEENKKLRTVQKYANKFKKYKLPPRKRDKLSTQVSRRSRRSQNKAVSSKTSQKFIITDNIGDCDSFSSNQSCEDPSRSYTSRAFSKKSGDITPVQITHRDRFKKYLNDSVAPKKHHEYLQQQFMSVAIQFVDSPQMFDENIGDYEDSHIYSSPQRHDGINRSMCDYQHQNPDGEPDQIYDTQYIVKRQRHKSQDFDNQQQDGKRPMISFNNSIVGTIKSMATVKNLLNKEPFQNSKPNVRRIDHKVYKEDDSVEAESSDGRPATVKNTYDLGMNRILFKSLEDNPSRHDQLGQIYKQKSPTMMNEYNNLQLPSVPSWMNQGQPNARDARLTSKMSMASKMKSFTTSLPPQDDSIESSQNTPSNAHRKKSTPQEYGKHCQDSNDESMFQSSQMNVWTNSNDDKKLSKPIARVNGIKTSRYQVPRLALSCIRDSGQGQIIEQPLAELNVYSDEEMSEIRDELPQSYVLQRSSTISESKQMESVSHQRTLRRIYETEQNMQTNMQTTSEAKIGEEMPTISEHEQKSSDSQDVPSMDEDDEDEAESPESGSEPPILRSHERSDLITIKLFE